MGEKVRTRWLCAGMMLIMAMACGAYAWPEKMQVYSDKPNVIAFKPRLARFVTLLVYATNTGNEACIDEIEIYAEGSDENLALTSRGAKATASSCIAGHAIHQIAHINDGRYGNDHSWVAGGSKYEWVQIELSEPARVDRVVFSRDRKRYFGDRVPTWVEVSLSLDGKMVPGQQTEPQHQVREFKAEVVPVVLRQKGEAAAMIVPDPPAPPAAAGSSSAPGSQGLRAAARDAMDFANLAINPNAVASASSLLPGYEFHTIPHLNDGILGNAHSWISNGDPSWAEIDLGQVFWVYNVAFGSDSSGQHADRAPATFSIEVASEQDAAGEKAWHTVAAHTQGTPVHRRQEFPFNPAPARWVRIVIESTNGGNGRVDEIEIYGSPDPIPADRVASLLAPRQDSAPSVADASLDEDQLRYAFLTEEHAWLKTYGRADLDPRLVPYNGRVQQYPRHVGDDIVPLPALAAAPVIDGRFDDPAWQDASRGMVRVAWPYEFDQGPLAECAVRAGRYGEDLYLQFEFTHLLSTHLAILSGGDGAGCGVVTWTDKGLVFNVYTKESGGGTPAESIPLDAASDGTPGRWEARVPLDRFPSCRDEGLRVGLGMGGRHTDKLGRPVRFVWSPLAIAEQGRWADGRFTVRVAVPVAESPVTLTGPGLGPDTVLTLQPGESRTFSLEATRGPIGPESTFETTDAFGETYALHLFRYDPVERALTLAEETIARIEEKGLDVTSERAELAVWRARQRAMLALKEPDVRAERAAFFGARAVKRAVFLRDPGLAPLQRVLFCKRHPFEPSHNYSEFLDAPYRGGGGVCLLDTPWRDGRLASEDATVTTLFHAGDGIPRTPMADFDLSKIFFAYRPSPEGYFHIMVMNPDGTGLHQITDGPFNDVWPCPLPDGDLAMISTRCKARFLCWRPQAFILFRMKPDGTDLWPLSYANLSEWAPSVMSDGRLIWTRSEYQDKGADFGHTLWSIRPDGTQPELVFGNDIIQPNGYANGREVPGTKEVCCTLISHFGDLNGPIALVDTAKGRFTAEAITSLTPEVPWPGMWPATECFRDPVPISRDLFLCSHAPLDRFGIYVIDRFGNREALFLDPAISSMCPTVFEARPRPPVLATNVNRDVDYGEFVLQDVYSGITPPVERGQVKYLRIVEEVRAGLVQLADGSYQSDHESFLDYYATPVHVVYGPYGWPTYVAKAPHGLVPVEEDGSARFRAPAGKVLYFQALDENLNELQRMRSVVQLQPGESRSCIGCHERRELTPANARRILAKEARDIETPEWCGVPFSYETVVQPVLDRNCVACHAGDHPKGLDLRGDLDAEKVPASYRTLIANGLVHYADMQWNAGGCEFAPPLSLGTVRSRLWEVLNAGHHRVELSRDDMHRIKAWIDLNCPLWPDYINRADRPGPETKTASAR